MSSEHHPNGPFRVYLKNLHYLVNEEDLHALFEKYDPVSILVPTYTVKFNKSGKRKSFCCAYVELRSPEQVEAAVKQFDGILYHEKKLIAKPFTPYSPSHRSWLGSKSPRIQSEGVDTQNEQSIAQTGEPDVPNDEGNENDQLSIKSKILIQARGEFTSVAVETFLKDYKPTDVYICKSKKSILDPLTLTGPYYSAVATVDTSSKTLDQIIKSLKTKKLMGKRVKLKPATTENAKQIEKSAISYDSGEPSIESHEASSNMENEQASSAAVPMDLDSPDPTSMIVSPGSTLSSNFNARINSP